MKLIFEAQTDNGRSMTNNQDSFLVDREIRLFVVADGMGGHVAGEIASSLAVKVFHEFLIEHRSFIDRYRDDDNEVTRHEILDLLSTGIRRASKEIHNIATSEEGKHGMGTTVSAIMLVRDRAFIAHVGDSRIYLLRDGQVWQLTEDHSLLNELIKRGKLKEEEVQHFPFRNTLTRAVGVYEDVQVDTLDSEIDPGDSFLVCSDGLSKYFENQQEIIDILSSSPVSTIPSRLIDMANDRGGKDNITVIVVRVDALQDSNLSEIAIKIETLQRMPLFRFLSYVELVRIINIAEVETYKTDDCIVTEGEEGDKMYLVLRGIVKVSKGDTEIARLSNGGHFGEMALLDKQPRSASVRAATSTSLLSLRRREFLEIMAQNKEIATKLLWSFVQVLNSRLRNTSRELSTTKNELLDLGKALEVEQQE